MKTKLLAQKGGPLRGNVVDEMYIESLTFETAKVDEVVEFYQHVLEVTVAETTADFTTLHVGTTSLRWQQAEGSTAFYHFAIDVPAKIFSELVDLVGKRVELLREDGESVHHFPDWNASAIYFHDPAGNIVELIARRNLDEPFGNARLPECLMRVSEIGIPCEDLDAEADKWNLPVWRDYGFLRALGEESGLLVLVPIGRGWKPTRRPAERYFCRAILASQDGHTRVVKVN